jgi:hypothetical protein
VGVDAIVAAATALTWTARYDVARRLLYQRHADALLAGERDTA